MGAAAAQTPEEQNRELVRSSELGRDSCGRRLGDLSCSMPRLSGRSLDSGAHRAANCGGERQAIEQRSRRGWEGSPILAVDHPWGPAAAPVTANLAALGEHWDALAPRRVACPVLSLAADDAGGRAAGKPTILRAEICDTV